MHTAEKNWYVVYTKPRWEKKVHQLMATQGFESYCPLSRVRKKWSDRIKWVEEPLFKSYVFVHIREEDKPAVRMVGGVVNFVYWLGQPAIVREKEVENIRKFLNEYDEVWAEPMPLEKDVRVTILKGVFMDREATVMKVINNKVRLLIESIGYSLVAVFDRSNIAAIGQQASPKPRGEVNNF